MKEIRDVKWFDIADLPSSVKDRNCKEITGYSATSFFLVLPFLNKLKTWIQEKKSTDSSMIQILNTETSVEESESSSSSSMLPQQFLPESWKTFSFEQEEISLLSMGFPAEFTGRLRYGFNI